MDTFGITFEERSPRRVLDKRTVWIIFSQNYAVSTSNFPVAKLLEVSKFSFSSAVRFPMNPQNDNESWKHEINEWRPNWPSNSTLLMLDFTSQRFFRRTTFKCEEPHFHVLKRRWPSNLANCFFEETANKLLNGESFAVDYRIYSQLLNLCSQRIAALLLTDQRAAFKTLPNLLPETTRLPRFWLSNWLLQMSWIRILRIRNFSRNTK